MKHLHRVEAFLRERRAEVIKAMTIDMTFERREELIRKEEREYGRREGREEGRKEGRKEGREEGREAGRREIIEELISKGIITPEEVKRINNA